MTETQGTLAMTLEQALEKLTPWHSKIPITALDVIRSNWHEAEAKLLDELDRCIEQPLEEESSAFFLYALYLCAEMRSEAAFERYVRILRLPNLLLDHLLGDILTQSMDRMLARTCAARSTELKALVEDETVFEFARSAALLALQHLVISGTLAREEIEQYCIDLLTGKLERYPSYAWDAAVSMAMELDLKPALPLIEIAYLNRLVDPMACTLKEVRESLEDSSHGFKLLPKREEQEAFDTAREMNFFVWNWKDVPEPDPTELLQEVRNESREQPREQLQPEFGKVGRNEPCPCGSGIKYKKCCIDREISVATGTEREVVLLNAADEWIAAGYHYSEKSIQNKALSCWWHGWQEAEAILPDDIQDPKAEECNNLFAGFDYFSDWLEDYRSLIENNFRWNADTVHNGLQFCLQVMERFPLMDSIAANNMTETTAYLLLALGRSTEAFALLERMIQQQPDTAQGYAVWAALLSLEARRFQLRPDIDRAHQLLQQALEQATDCGKWNIELRLTELQEQ